MKSPFVFPVLSITAAMKAQTMMRLFSFIWIDFQNMIHTSILDFLSACGMMKGTPARARRPFVRARFGW